MRKFNFVLYIVIFTYISFADISCERSIPKKQQQVRKIIHPPEHKRILNTLAERGHLEFPPSTCLLHYKEHRERYYLLMVKVQIDKTDLMPFLKSSPFIDDIEEAYRRNLLFGGKGPPPPPFYIVFSDGSREPTDENLFSYTLYGPDDRPYHRDLVFDIVPGLEWWKVSSVKNWKSGRVMASTDVSLSILIDLDHADKIIIYLECLN